MAAAPQPWKRVKEVLDEGRLAERHFMRADHDLPGAGLRSLDALHLGAAIRLEVEAVLTYDVRMAEAATSLGLDVLAPV